MVLFTYNSVFFRYQNYIKAKIREAGQYLLELRTAAGDPKATLDSFLEPQKFDLLIAVTKKMNSPARQLKTGHLIHKLCKILRGQAIRNGDDKMKARSDDVRQLYLDEWTIEIASR